MVWLVLACLSFLAASIIAFTLMCEATGMVAVLAFICGVAMAGMSIGELYCLGDIYDLYKFCEVKEKQNEN